MTLPSSGPLSLNDIQGEFGGSNPIGINEYYAGGGLVPAGTSGTYGAVPTSGQISIQNFYGTSNYIPTYIEDVFSTYLYTASNQVAQTITNGINLSGKGGLVWIKARSAAYEHFLADTARGAANYLQSQSTAAQINNSTELTSFNSNGFSIGTDSSGIINFGSTTLTSWTFRKQPKFFDVVTYTGNDTAGRNISHNLGSVPGCIIVKNLTNGSANWYVYHQSLGNATRIFLNLTDASSASTNWNNTTPTSTVFTVGNGVGVNASGNDYVAYLFAHNAGGFGLTGTDNVITCGSAYSPYNTDTTVTLGWEPQWVLIKPTNQGGGSWKILDTMRGFIVGGTDAELYANSSNVESLNQAGYPTATGFVFRGFDNNANGGDHIYIAIRRGPMKTPTSGTSVYVPITATASTGTTRTVGFAADMLMAGVRAGDYINITDRLRGFAQTTTGTGFPVLKTALTNAEQTNETPYAAEIWNSTARDGSGVNGASTIWWYFRRAPGFFDEVCYTGDATGTKAIAHNLGVAPELYIVKGRTGSPTYGWYVYSAALGNTKSLVLNTTAAAATTTWTWDSTSPTATSFYVTSDDTVGGAGRTYVAYLFASCPGVSKVGSYSGTGATQTISCGFAARFVLIKRTDSTGDWFVWDTARGMVAGTDPRLALNSTAAETNANWVYTNASGFQIVTTDATVNASGGSYIFFAVA